MKLRLQTKKPIDFYLFCIKISLKKSYKAKLREKETKQLALFLCLLCEILGQRIFCIDKKNFLTKIANRNQE